MTNKEFRLDEYIMNGNDFISCNWLDVLDVKQAIKLLKERLKYICVNEIEEVTLLRLKEVEREIDKIMGDKLI